MKRKSLQYQPNPIIYAALNVSLILTVLVLSGCSEKHSTMSLEQARVFQTNPMLGAKTAHTANYLKETALGEGILVLGGAGSPCIAEFYRLDKKSHMLKTPSFCRFGHTATTLANDEILVVGGLASLKPNISPHSVSEIYSSQTMDFSETGSLQTGRYGHTATLMNDGNILITGGFTHDEYGKKQMLESAELYYTADREFGNVGKMAYLRAGHTATLLDDGSVIVIGGTDGKAEFEKYDPVNQEFETIGGTGFIGSNHTATKMGEHILIAGGLVGSLASERQALLLDLISYSLINVEPLKIGRSGHTANLLPNGDVILVGGNGSNHWGLSSIEHYHSKDRTFSILAFLKSPRVSHRSNFIESENSILVSGGWGNLTLTGPKILREVDLIQLTEASK